IDLQYQERKAHQREMRRLEIEPCRAEKRGEDPRLASKYRVKIQHSSAGVVPSELSPKSEYVCNQSCVQHAPNATSGQWPERKQHEPDDTSTYADRRTNVGIVRDCARYSGTHHQQTQYRQEDVSRGARLPAHM